jgi:hypothetical protein
VAKTGIQKISQEKEHKDSVFKFVDKLFSGIAPPAWFPGLRGVL